MKNFKGKGFTLIEMLVVIGIIAIVATISFPVYQNMRPSLKLNAAARDLTSDLRHAQQLAVTEQVIYDVIFNTVASSYEIRRDNDNSLISQKTLPVGVIFSDIGGLTDNTAKFTATGAAVEPTAIILASNGSKQSTIEIKPSGYVKISN